MGLWLVVDLHRGANNQTFWNNIFDLGPPCWGSNTKTSVHNEFWIQNKKYILIRNNQRQFSNSKTFAHALLALQWVFYYFGLKQWHLPNSTFLWLGSALAWWEVVFVYYAGDSCVFLSLKYVCLWLFHPSGDCTNFLYPIIGFWTCKEQIAPSFPPLWNRVKM